MKCPKCGREAKGPYIEDAGHWGFGFALTCPNCFYLVDYEER